MTNLCKLVSSYIKHIPFLVSNVWGCIRLNKLFCAKCTKQYRLRNVSNCSDKMLCTRLLKLRAKEIIVEKKTSFAYLSSSKPNLVSHLFQNKVILIFSAIVRTSCYKSYSTMIISCLMLHAETNPKFVEHIAVGLLLVTVSRMCYIPCLYVLLSHQNVSFSFPSIVPDTCIDTFQSTHAKNSLRKLFQINLFF